MPIEVVISLLFELKYNNQLIGEIMIASNVKIFPGAQVMGDVEINEKSSIWYNAVVRGDIGSIKIGKYSNIQDNCVVHSPTVIGDYVTVGHAAVVHACQIEDNCLIGMNSTILDGAKIGANSIVGAGAVVTQGKEFPEGSLIMGIPAKAVRELGEDEIENLKKHAVRYAELAGSYDL
jgi:carbonic anhydrase/acetyltransferase-like protein (isoleucine patch superfamily)